MMSCSFLKFSPMPSSLPSNSPVVLVLASGRGERFVASGGSGSKLRALLAGVPVLERTLAAVKASGLPWHLEDAGHEGMGDSIAAAVRATQEASGWLVLPGDLPLIRPQSLQQVAAALASHAVVLPRHRGQRGHPVGFDASCRGALLILKGPQGAQAIVQAQAAAGRVVELDMDDAGVVIDIDTVADLQAAEQRLAPE
jgi:molybdenum cofactor cytidylyltransferase